MPSFRIAVGHVALFVNTGARKDLLSFRVPKTLRHFKNNAMVNYVYYVMEYAIHSAFLYFLQYVIHNQ